MGFRQISLFVASAAIALAPSATNAQRQQASPEQRLERLERQVEQVQRQVFPRGRPADTAGFAYDPAASQASVITLNQRLDALERQMTDLLRQSEDNANRLQTLTTDVGRLRNDQEQRIQSLEQRLSEAASAAAPAAAEPAPAPATTRPRPQTPATRPQSSNGGARPAAPDAGTGGPAAAAAVQTDPGEDAYTAGFKLWEAGELDQAIASLKSFTAEYPKHRRVSFANNLIGRALLDKGDAQAAAQALLANYRGNPKGERAADSLYYLGQALMKLGQPGQACKAYAELDAVYGAKVRADLKKLVTDAKSQAQCA